MKKLSKRDLFIIVIAVVVLLALGAFVVYLFGGGTLSHGTFLMSAESHNNAGCRFSARRANGDKDFTHNFTQEELDNLVVESSIREGEMVLILIQNETRQTIDLSKGAMKLSAEDIDVSAFSPGRITMRLEFMRARNVSVKIGWR